MKNKFMRIAAVMLMLCLVTTCAISGTFAKYTTANSGDDSARVAYWGWNETAAVVDIDDLFMDNYSTDVKSSVDVIAPGTGSSGTFKFEYAPKTAGSAAATPEVSYEFTVSTAGSDCDDAIKNNDNIIWKLDGAPVASWDALLDAIEALAGNTTNGVTATDGVANYGPSAGYLPDIATSTHTIEWEWVFETAGDAAQDEQDTAMGNTNADINVVLKITVSATQTNA